VLAQTTGLRRPATLVRVDPAGRPKNKDQKAERAVVHALGPAVGDRPGEASGVGASEDLGSRARVISKRTGLAPL
jgi:hypothetical protein